MVNRGTRIGRLWDRWQDHASRAPEREAIVHWMAGERPHRWYWGDLVGRAQGFATSLRSMGVERGDVCALIFRHHRDFYPLYMGIEALGALPSVLAYPNPRLHPDKFRQGIEGMSRRSGLDWLLTEPSLEPALRPLVAGSGSTIREILLPLDREHPVPSDGSEWRSTTAISTADEPCLLQHSSGTTGLQKAVMLSHRAVLEHVAHYGRAIALTPDDRVVSWLPLYHDMGLIAAFHLPLAFGVPTVQIDPFEWVAAPVLLIEAVFREMGTLTWLPNFAYNLLVDRVSDEDMEGLRVDTLRMVINCSEPVRAESHDRFRHRFAPYGLREGALAACYAMAETTFAVTQTVPSQDAKSVAASRDELARGRFRATAEADSVRWCVSSGIPIDGCEVDVVGDAGERLPDDTIGEIVIHSVSMFDGYRHAADATAEVLRSGWYSSGDLGFRHGGELYVIGRKKDIIIVAGKNLYPEDIEDALGGIDGILPGRVVAFGADDPESGTERICVVAETALTGAQETKQLRRAVVEAAMQIDVTISAVFLVPPRWLIKSSAGKPSRRANKERALRELVAP